MNSILLPLGKNVFHQILTKSRVPLIQQAYLYRSSLSPENRFPNSPKSLITVKPVPESKDEEFTGFIPIKKLDITYSCSSGPGGQNVNKVHTKVDLRFKLNEADWLSPSLREKLLKDHYTKITKDGYFVVKSELTRSQQLNLADCMRKLRDLIWKTANPPVKYEMAPERIRRRLEKAARERLRVKRANSQLLQLRKPPTVLDL